MQKVYNLESFTEGDLKTYETLHDVINYHKDKPEDFEYELIRIDNQTKLFESLSKIKEESRQERHPLLHFDVHGDEEGIELRSGEFIKWLEFTFNFPAYSL